MNRLTIEGTDIKELQTQLDAWYRPGKKLQLDLGLPRDLSVEELSIIQDRLTSEGLRLIAPIEIGSGPWQNTLRLKFENPKGYAQFGIPLVVMIILAVGAVGIAAFLGWKVGEVFQQWFPAIAVLALAGVLGYAYVTSRK